MSEDDSLVDKKDVLPGHHLKSLRSENKADNIGVTSLSFMFLHDITLRLSSSFHERTTISRPRVVSREHPSIETNFSLL